MKCTNVHSPLCSMGSDHCGQLWRFCVCFKRSNILPYCTLNFLYLYEQQDCTSAVPSSRDGKRAGTVKSETSFSRKKNLFSLTLRAAHISECNKISYPVQESTEPISPFSLKKRWQPKVWGKINQASSMRLKTNICHIQDSRNWQSEA